MPSQHQQRKANIARKRHNRSLGICVNDGLPVAENLDGTNSVFCEDCKADYVLRTATHRKPVRADIDYDAAERRAEIDDDAYSLKVKRIIEKADAEAGENYKGVTIGYIKGKLGDEADLEMIGRSVGCLNLFEAQMVPERYSLLPPPVRYVGHEKWGTAVDPRGYQFSSRLNVQSVYGARQK